MLNRKHITFFLQLNLALAFAGGFLVLWSFLKEPSEPGSAVFLGFSFLRLILMLVVFSLLLILLALLFGSLRNSWQPGAIESFFVKLSNQKWIFWILISWMAISYILLFLPDDKLGSLAPYRERLFPVLLWFAVLSIQFGFVVLYFRGINADAIRAYRGILLSSLVALLLYGLLLMAIALTRIGLTPDKVYWQAPGAPILLHQIFLAALAGALFYLFLEHTSFGQSTKLDLLVFLGIWGFASLVWLNQPADFTWFSWKPTPPNYQSYPFSDSLLYDGVAREFLIGKPIPSDFWAKPVYSLFLAVLHLFARGNYSLLISLQVIFLALIPAIAYLLAKRLDARPAGLVLALLLILREHNALALSNVIQVSHTKLILSDIFAMGWMVLLLWLFFHWVENPGGRRVMPLVLGGIFGLLVLTRGHPIVLLPFLLFAVFVVPVSKSRLRWEVVALTFLGFAIAFLPWLWRNYELTGKLTFRYSDTLHNAAYSSVYTSSPSGFGSESLPPRHLGESDSAYGTRLQAQAVKFVMEHPDQVVKFVSDHYFHNLIHSYIYLPYSFQIEEVREYVKTQPFWSGWMGDLSVEESILLFINLGMIALGLGTLWKKYKHLAFVPLFLGIGYNLSASAGRVSGWRFILPVDWITLIYYAIGMMQFYLVLRALTNKEYDPAPRGNERQHTVRSLKRSSLIGFALFFLFMGLVVTKGHVVFSKRYPVKSTAQLKQDYVRMTEAMPSAIPGTDLDEFLKNEHGVIAYGQALNPSFLPLAMEGLDDSWPVYDSWPNYKPKPFPRLIFNLNGPRYAGVILSMESAPVSFPDGVDVIVIGCQGESGEINAQAVLMQGDSPIHYVSGESPLKACP